MPKQLKYTGPVIKPFTRLRAYDRDIVPSIWTQEQIQKWLAIEPRYAEFFTEVDTPKGQVNDNALPPAPKGEPAQEADTLSESSWGVRDSKKGK